MASANLAIIMARVKLARRMRQVVVCFTYLILMENVNAHLSYQLPSIFAPQKAQEGITKKELVFAFQECLRPSRLYPA
jgi:hypothetical protein